MKNKAITYITTDS